MPCRECGARNPAGARFCVTCGARLPLTCPSCASEVQESQRYCANCGRALRHELVAEIDGTDVGDGPPAERRLVSVMFVDLAGFTRIAETLDPEEVKALQDRYFELARLTVSRYGGTLEKYIGDAIMAVWGAPRAKEDDAERAVRAALDVVAGVSRLRLGRRRLQARAAVTTGEAAVTLGSEGQGMLAGDLVNTAARLQQFAPRGGVLVDGTTRRVATSSIEFVPVGTTRLRGRSGPVAAWRATGARGAGDDGRAAGHPGPFVGRAAELEELTELYRRTVADRRSRLVSVIGIAGIGKSRLSWELVRRLGSLAPDTIVLAGQAPAYEEGLTFAPLTEMVRRFAAIPRDMAPEAGLEMLSEGLERAIPQVAERDWLRPRVAALLDPRAGAAFERDELFAAWRRFLEHVSNSAPLVLIFEDMQWADAPLLDFVDHLAAWSRDHPMMIVSLARPELLDRRPGWGADQSRFTAVQLEPLAAEAMRRLLEALVPSLSHAQLEQIVARAGGVPLYGVEVARMLAGSPRSAPSEIPETLHSLVAARIDALPPVQRRLLLSAAVLGQRFSARSLKALTGLEDTSLSGPLELLVRRELLAFDEEPGPLAAGQLRFMQQLVREVAYRTLSRRQRRVQHLAAAEHLAAAAPDEVESIAEHLYSSHEAVPDHPAAPEVAARAVEALREAAARASALHAPARAFTHLERALALSPSGARRVELLEEAAATARAAARFDLAEALLREFISWHEVRGDGQQAARGRAQLASLMLATERHPSALADLELALQAIEDWQRDPAGVELAGQLARGRMLIGDDEHGHEWAEKAVELARRQGLTATAVDALITRGTAAVHLGQRERGLADLRQAIGEASQLGLLRAELRARNNLAWLMVLEDPHATLQTAQGGLELASSMGVADMALQLSEVVSAVALQTGDWELALKVIEQVRDRPQALAHRLQFVTSEVIILAFRGQLPAARALLDGTRVPEGGVLPQIVAGLERARAWLSYLAGEFDDARLRAMDAAAELLWADRAAALLLAGRGCIWLGDAAGVASAAAQLGELSSGGRVVTASELSLRAALAALSGGDAAAQYEAAAELWSELNLPLELGLTLAERQRLLGSSSGSDAEAVLTRLGALGVLEMLQAMR